jgi:hypothetical protein
MLSLLTLNSKNLAKSRHMTKMVNFAEFTEVAHIQEVWSLLSTKIAILSKPMESVICGEAHI